MQTRSIVEYVRICPIALERFVSILIRIDWSTIIKSAKCVFLRFSEAIGFVFGFVVLAVVCLLFMPHHVHRQVANFASLCDGTRSRSGNYFDNCYESREQL